MPSGFNPQMLSQLMGGAQQAMPKPPPPQQVQPNPVSGTNMKPVSQAPMTPQPPVPQASGPPQMPGQQMTLQKLMMLLGGTG